MINLKDKLSHLSFIQACKLLGPQGKDHLIQGGMWDVDLEEQVILKRDLFYLDLGEAGVTLHLDPAKNHKIDISCSVCPRPRNACPSKASVMRSLWPWPLTNGLNELKMKRCA